MIRLLNEDTSVVTLDLADLEHCGFAWDAYQDELFLAGLEDATGTLPQVFIVNVAGGQVCTPGSSAEMVAAARAAQARFDRLVEALAGALAAIYGDPPAETPGL